jgi:hypothetical protein
MIPIRSAIRGASVVLSVLAIACLCVACAGFSEEEAAARCDQEEEARAAGGCFTAATYDACLAAYEECGEDVDIDEACPPTFRCPD